jgi:1-deoxy-D-xylulose-5-phosphate reductoisomerase
MSGHGQNLNGVAADSSSQKRRVSVLGATGTIGQHTCDIIAAHADRFEVVALTAHKNARKLAELAIALKAEFAAIADEGLGEELRALLDGTGIESGSGPKAITEAGGRPAGWIMASIVGAAGLEPTLAAVRQGTTVALANKECLVSAGDLFMAEAAAHKTTLIPVDSEHSAVFQALDAPDCKHVQKIILTASGGPFRTWTAAQIAAAKPEDALKHPNWSMGRKITIDSATLMNKGLEIIEAFHLFNVHQSQLSAIIHPQSIIHCLVYYSDGSVIAQASLPDMRTPIAYSLAWPSRLTTDFARLDLATAGQLTFEEADDVRFPALRVAREALYEGGIAPTVLNAANEVAVEAFLNGAIPFMGIPALVEETIDGAQAALAGLKADTLESVLHADAQARLLANEIMARGKTVRAAGGEPTAVRI